MSATKKKKNNTNAEDREFSHLLKHTNIRDYDNAEDKKLFQVILLLTSKSLEPAGNRADIKDRESLLFGFLNMILEKFPLTPRETNLLKSAIDYIKMRINRSTDKSGIIDRVLHDIPFLLRTILAGTDIDPFISSHFIPMLLAVYRKRFSQSSSSQYGSKPNQHNKNQNTLYNGLGKLGISNVSIQTTANANANKRVLKKKTFERTLGIPTMRLTPNEAARLQEVLSKNEKPLSTAVQASTPSNAEFVAHTIVASKPPVPPRGSAFGWLGLPGWLSGTTSPGSVPVYNGAPKQSNVNAMLNKMYAAHPTTPATPIKTATASFDEKEKNFNDFLEEYVYPTSGSASAARKASKTDAKLNDAKLNADLRQYVEELPPMPQFTPIPTERPIHIKDRFINAIKSILAEKKTQVDKVSFLYDYIGNLATKTNTFTDKQIESLNTYKSALIRSGLMHNESIYAAVNRLPEYFEKAVGTPFDTYGNMYLDTLHEMAGGKRLAKKQSKKQSKKSKKTKKHPRKI